mmetsp:Transcript_132968/g.384474  ORF Transcript_132968/g.384474 Transcript_132968/m.384474 type:complete len:278 (+) Transcript_132968:284-1117(+)
MAGFWNGSATSPLAKAPPRARTATCLAYTFESTTISSKKANASSCTASATPSQSRRKSASAAPARTSVSLSSRSARSSAPKDETLPRAIAALSRKALRPSAWPRQPTACRNASWEMSAKAGLRSAAAARTRTSSLSSWRTSLLNSDETASSRPNFCNSSTAVARISQESLSSAACRWVTAQDCGAPASRTRAMWPNARMLAQRDGASSARFALTLTSVSTIPLSSPAAPQTDTMWPSTSAATIRNSRCFKASARPLMACARTGGAPVAILPSAPTAA